MSKAACVLAFVLGAAAGSVVSWKLLETKYDQIAQEKINSIKERYSNKEEVIQDEIDLFSDEDTDESIEDIYKSIISESKYSNEIKKEGASTKKSKVYVISPDEYDEIGYKTENLTWYADNILAYDSDEIVTNIDFVVGEESLDHFGEYEDDSVFVRNDTLKTDFQILLDMRCYEDVVSSKEITVDEDDK